MEKEKEIEDRKRRELQKQAAIEMKEEMKEKKKKIEEKQSLLISSELPYLFHYANVNEKEAIKIAKESLEDVITPGLNPDERKDYLKQACQIIDDIGGFNLILMSKYDLKINSLFFIGSAVDETVFKRYISTYLLDKIKDLKHKFHRFM